MTDRHNASARELVGRLDHFYRQRLGMKGAVPLHQPAFAQADRDYVLDCIESGWVSSVGSYVTRFEECVSTFCGTRFGIAAVNGTAALHLSLVALGVERGDLVICPPLTFVATANAIAYCGAEPLFCDIDEATLGLSARAVSHFLERECRLTEGTCRHLATGRRVSAILPVHVFGHPVEMDALLAAGRQWGLPVIEDATEALGSSYNGAACGSMGQVGVFSFNGNKICTTGGGGMVVTNDGDLAGRIRHLATTARLAKGWEFVHDEVGYNYRLPNLNAALGCAQMTRLDQYVQQKRALWDRYDELTRGLCGIELVAEPPGTRSNYWLHAILFSSRALRDMFLEETNGRDIQTRPCWRLVADLKPYSNAIRYGALPVARDVEARLVNIPSSPRLGEALAA